MTLSLALYLGIALQEPNIIASRDFVSVKDKAYMMLPPDVAASSIASNLVWSASGDNLAMQRNTLAGTKAQIAGAFVGGQSRPPTLKTELLIYNRKSKASRSVMSLSGGRTLISMEWIGSSNSMLIQTSQMKEGDEDRTLELFVVSTSGEPKKIASQVGGWFAADVDTKSSTIAFSSSGTQTDGPSVLRIANSNGKVFPAIALPWTPTTITWQSGKVYLATWESPPRARGAVEISSGPPAAKYVSYDPKTNRVESMVAPPEYVAPDAKKPALVGFAQELDLPLPSEKPSKFKIIALMSSDAETAKDVEVGVVSTDGGDVTVSPDMGAVAYISQGVAMVRELVVVDRQVLLAARDAAERAAALSNAKQVGLGILMYAGDNDDNYPANAGWEDKIFPYLKNRDVMKGFNYTFSGGNATSLERPAETMLGFVDCPGGRAVVYADGHAKFVPNP